MRHSHPGGELGPIVERALDSLIESLMQRRFGKREKALARPTSERARDGELEQLSNVVGDQIAMRCTAEPDTNTRPTAEPATTALADATGHCSGTHGTAEPGATEPATAKTSELAAVKTLETVEPNAAEPNTVEPVAPATLDTADVQRESRDERTRASTSSYIPRSTRRTVVERDGLGCSWVDEHGVRCGCRSWLEYDHRRPRAKGGGSEPDNVRFLCRSHNRLAAEREYGRGYVEQTIAERRRERAPRAIGRVDQAQEARARKASEHYCQAGTEGLMGGPRYDG